MSECWGLAWSGYMGRIHVESVARRVKAARLTAIAVGSRAPRFSAQSSGGGRAHAGRNADGGEPPAVRCEDTGVPGGGHHLHAGAEPAFSPPVHRKVRKLIDAGRMGDACCPMEAGRD